LPRSNAEMLIPAYLPALCFVLEYRTGFYETSRDCVAVQLTGRLVIVMYSYI